MNAGTIPSVIRSARRPGLAQRAALAGGTIAVLCATIAPMPALAGSEDRVADHERWSPSVAFQMGFLRHDAIGRATSDLRPPSAGGTTFYGDNLLFDYTFGLSFDVMAPALTDDFWRPQPFVHLDIMHPLGLEVDVAREGSPDGFNIPDFGVPDTTIPANAVGGQGMKTEIEIQSPAAAAGVGLSFSFEAFDQAFRIRPSVQYYLQRMEASGVVLDADGQRVISGGVLVEELDFTVLEGASNKVMHAIGGGVDLEMEVAEVSGGKLSLGAGFHLYHLQGDRKFGFTASNGTNSATWGAKVDPLVYRAAFSLRYRFLPRGDRR